MAEAAPLPENARLVKPVANERSNAEAFPPTDVTLIVLMPLKRVPTSVTAAPAEFAKIKFAIELAPLPVNDSPAFRVELANAALALVENTPLNEFDVAVSILVVSGLVSTIY